MNKLKIFFCLTLLLCAGFLGAQPANTDPAPEMADLFYKEGKVYTVVVVISIVFGGIALYMFWLDRKLSRLEKKMKEKN